MTRLLAVCATASRTFACHALAAHVPTHVIAQISPQTLGLIPLVIVGVVIGSLMALARAARLAITLISQLMQVATRMTSTLFTLVIFVVVITTLLAHLR